MSDLQKDAKHWHGRILDLIASIYQVKNEGLGRPFEEDGKWHENLSRVAAELRLLSAWLARLAAQA